MFRNIFLFMKILTATIGLALLVGVVIGLSYILSIFFSALCIIIVIGIIVSALLGDEQEDDI